MNVAEDALKIGIIQNNPEAAKVETAEQTPKVATVTNTSTNVDDVKFMGNPTSDEPKGSFVIVNGDVKTNPVEGKNSEITSTDRQVPNKIETGSADQSNKVDEKLVNELVEECRAALSKSEISDLRVYIEKKLFVDSDGDGLDDHLDKDPKSRGEKARDKMLEIMENKFRKLGKNVGDMVGTIKKVLSIITGLDESNKELIAASEQFSKLLKQRLDSPSPEILEAQKASDIDLK